MSTMTRTTTITARLALILCLMLAPPLGFMARNISRHPFGELAPALLAGALFALVPVALLLLSMARPRLRRLEAVAIGLAVLWYLQFNWAALAKAATAAGLPADWARNAVMLLVFAAAIALARLAARPPVFTMLAIYAALILSANVVKTGLGALRDTPAAMPATGADAPLPAPAAAAARPNIYYVIVDGMGSAENIRRGTGADISSFESALRSRGFYIASEARSSYNLTHLTVGSILNLAYHDPRSRYRDDNGFYPKMLRPNEPLPPLLRQARGLGYEFVHVGNSWAPCNSGHTHARCLRDIGRIDEEGLLVSLRDSYALGAFLKGSLLEKVADRLFERVRGHYRNDTLVLTLDFLAANPGVITARPAFYLIHTLIPHPPHLNEACDVVGDRGNYTIWDVPGYRHSVACVTRRMQQFADRIAQVDRDAIIVFQGDHGPAFTYPFEKTPDGIDAQDRYERFAIFNAMRLPPECRPGLAPNLGSVETIQLVMECVESGRTVARARQPQSFAGFYKDSGHFGTLYPVDTRPPARATAASRD